MPAKLLFLIPAFFPLTTSLGQQTAVTQNGEQVVLYADGTWAYVHRDSLQTEDIPRNDGVFRKDQKADFLVTSKRIPVGCWIDPKKWTFQSAPAHEAAEYELEHTNGSLYALLITENLDLPLINLGNIALQNAREAAPDLTVTAKEFRSVNGAEVLMMRMTGTIQDIRFSYYGYYYTGVGAATQFLVYSSEALMNEHVEEVEALLNGFVKTGE